MRWAEDFGREWEGWPRERQERFVAIVRKVEAELPQPSHGEAKLWLTPGKPVVVRTDGGVIVFISGEQAA